MGKKAVTGGVGVGRVVQTAVSGTVPYIKCENDAPVTYHGR